MLGVARRSLPAASLEDTSLGRGCLAPALWVPTFGTATRPSHVANVVLVFGDPTPVVPIWWSARNHRVSSFDELGLSVCAFRGGAQL